MNVQDNESILKKPTKSRHLSTLDYFETLQVEYIVADLRCRIYPRLKDKAFWDKVKEGKRVTIEKLAERNKLPTIFTEESMLRELEKKVYRENSYPIFTYKSEEHRYEQEYYDLLFYYNVGAEVRVSCDLDEFKIGKISREYIPIKDNHVAININSKEEIHPISRVTRIL
jgi:hypothetical protein